MRLSIYNKLFITFFIILVLIIIWKVPHEKNTSQASTTSIGVVR